MFIRSFRLKTAAAVCGAVLLGISLGLLVLLLASRSAQSPPEPSVCSETEPPESSGTEESGTAQPEEPSSEPSENQKTVWLTFDDGPSAVTADILDVLKEKEVPATFFVIGATTDRGRSLYQRIVDEGHALGIHSYSHRYQQIYASADAYWEDFNRLADHLEECAGVRPTIFRFPGGSVNKFADPEILNQIKQKMEKEGMVWFDWNALANDDGASAAPAEEMFENILQSAGDNEQILILMHDDALRTTAPECVSMLIDHYQGLGYTFEKLTADTEPIRFTEK